MRTQRKTTTEAELSLLSEAESFITENSISTWNQETHCAFLIKQISAIAPMGAEEKRKAFDLLSLHGCGGNASQFGQWLAANGSITKERDRSDILARWNLL